MSKLTEQALILSLKNCLKKKPLEKITIQDITEDCGISRSAFYYHFHDIYELFDLACSEIFSDTVGLVPSADSWEEGFMELLLKLREEKDLVYHLYHYTNREWMEQYLRERTRRLIYAVVEQDSKGLSLSDTDKDFITDFYKFAFVGLALQWIGDGMKEPPEALVRSFALIIRVQGKETLRAFAGDGSTQS